MIDVTRVGWQETWFGRYSAELTRYDIDPTCEIAFQIQHQIEYDVEKIVRNVLLQNLEPLTYKDIQPLVKDLYFVFDPNEQVKYKGNRIYKTKGDIADWEKQIAHELRQLKKKKQEKSEGR